MATPIAMPKLGITMEEGTIVEWPRAIGDHVQKGEVVLVIESEKAEVEIEASASGYVRHLYAEVGDTLECGAILGAITESAEEDFDPTASGRTGQFTSGIVSILGTHKIALYFTGNAHAGENLGRILQHRAKELVEPIQMCDALSRNVPKDFNL